MDLSSKLIHPIFKDFTQTELDYLLKIAKTVTFEKGSVIIHEGDLGQEIYVILDGQVDVTKESGIPGGEVIDLVTLGPGSVLGEIAVVTDRPRSATVTTAKTTTVLLLNIATIKQDTNAKSIYEKLLQNLTVELSKKLIYVGSKLIKCDTEEQYAAELAEDKSVYAPNSIVVLFGWKWVDIMYEVPFLAAHGYDAIKIYPPQEFVIKHGNPWWVVYQPVSYQLSSFYGTEEEFIKMLDFCHGYNIKVYADLILNHMADFVETESQHIGTNGHTFAKYSYGPLNSEDDRYEFDDFYHFDLTGNKQISNEDYCKLESVWCLEHYDLVHLPKLNLDSLHVIAVLRKYVKYLLSLGVDGFRIDAAKHLKVKAVEKIFAGLKTHDGLKPFSYQEYYTGAPMGIDVYSFMKKYFQIGYVTAFEYGKFLSDAINNRSNSLQKLVEYSFGSSWIHYPDNRAVVVIDNHDTERMMPNILNYKNAQNNAYVLAYIFMLAWPFGVPKIMSSFRFVDQDDPIPTVRVWQNGRNTCFDENSPWVAQHRWTTIANMVLFHSKTKEALGVSHIWADGNQVAFARTYQKAKEYVTAFGFVVINATEKTLKRRFETGLPSGKYYDFISGQLDGDKMQGPAIDVENYGFATITIRPFDAIAIVLGFVE
ncbi:alpha-amylase [Gammaproteobacteria bacterium]